MLNYERKFFQIRVVSTRFVSETKSVNYNFFCISDTSNSLSDCSKNFKKIDLKIFARTSLSLNITGSGCTNSAQVSVVGLLRLLSIMEMWYITFKKFRTLKLRIILSLFGQILEKHFGHCWNIACVNFRLQNSNKTGNEIYLQCVFRKQTKTFP